MKKTTKLRRKKCVKLTFVALTLSLIFMLAFSECTTLQKENADCYLLREEIAALKQQADSEKVALKMFECVEAQAKSLGVNKENLPFLLHKPGNKKAVLLLHGFTATPWETKELASFLAGNGFSVYAPLLKGHGVNPAVLKNVSLEDWYGSAVYGYELLSNLADEIYVVGASMGGLLGVLVAGSHPVEGLVTINTPVLVKDKRIYFASLLQYFIDYSSNPGVAGNEELYYYKERPVSAVAQLNQLINTAKRYIYNVNFPILVVQSKYDPLVDPISAVIILQGVKSQNKQVLMLEDSAHTLPRLKNKKKVFDAVLKFLNSQSG